MPLDTNARLQLAKTDPNLISYVFNAGEIEPEDSYLHQKFGGNYGKYEEMLIDPQVGGKLQERVGAVLGRSVIVDAITKGRKDIEAARIAQRIIDRNLVPYEQICGDFLFSGLLSGFAVQAVNGVREVTDKGKDEDEPDIKLLLPVLEFVPQRRFTFRYHEPEREDVPVCTDETLDPKEDIVLVKGYELRLLTKRAPAHGERCPKDRFFVFTYGSIKGTPQGYGLGARIRKFYEIRSECLKSGVLTGDRLGSPPVHGTYPDDLDPKDPEHATLVNAFNRLLQAISPNAHASTTEGFKINFLEPRAGGHQILNWLYSTATAEIANAIWGDRSYAEKETGSYAAQSAQNESRNENVTDSDCNSLDEQLGNQFWRWIGDKNYANANYPYVRRETASERRKLQQEVEEEELRSKRATTDRTLIIDLGLSVTNEYIQRVYGSEFSLPQQEPEPEEAVELSEANFAAHVNRYIDWNGLRLGVRYLPGHTRFPQFRSAKKLQNAYGFVQGYRAGSKALRCYIHPDLLKGETAESELFAVEQLNPETEELDEIKIMVGYPSIEAAELAYRREMPETYFGGIRKIEVAELDEYADYAEAEWKLYFFQGRRTGVIARSVEEARAKLKRGGTKLVKVRSLTETERKIAARGDWVRTGPNGEPPGYNPSKRGYGPAPKDHSEPTLEADLLDHYEERLVDELSQAYEQPLMTIQQRIEQIANSEATDAEKYRMFVEGIYDLYSEMNPEVITSVLRDGLSAGYLAGMHSERIDRDASDASTE